MKVPRQSKGNLREPDPEKMAHMRAVMQDVLRDDGASLRWRSMSGYVLEIPDLPSGTELPYELYLLVVCYYRLTQDDDFAQELTDWARRNCN